MALIDTYTKDEQEHIVKCCYSWAELIDKLGYATHSGSNQQTVKKRIVKEEIDVSHFRHKPLTRRNNNNVFCENSSASQQTLRRWYLKNAFTDYRCSICGMIPIWNGKPLTQILDHINGHNHDDRVENLRWVCPNCNQQLETTGFTKMHSESLQKTKKKIVNGVNKTDKELSEVSHKRKIQWPTRDELKQLIRSMTFLAIGKQYGVTDNAVRKWCKTMNLPLHKRDIKKYTDQEWTQV